VIPVPCGALDDRVLRAQQRIEVGSVRWRLALWPSELAVVEDVGHIRLGPRRCERPIPHHDGTALDSDIATPNRRAKYIEQLAGVNAVQVIEPIVIG
jgi:hypothetical protein